MTPPDTYQCQPSPFQLSTMLRSLVKVKITSPLMSSIIATRTFCTKTTSRTRQELNRIIEIIHIDTDVSPLPPPSFNYIQKFVDEPKKLENASYLALTAGMSTLEVVYVAVWASFIVGLYLMMLCIIAMITAFAGATAYIMYDHIFKDVLRHMNKEKPHSYARQSSRVGDQDQ